MLEESQRVRNASVTEARDQTCDSKFFVMIPFVFNLVLLHICQHWGREHWHWNCARSKSGHLEKRRIRVAHRKSQRRRIKLAIGSVRHEICHVKPCPLAHLLALTMIIVHAYTMIIVHAHPVSTNHMISIVVNDQFKTVKIFDTLCLSLLPDMVHAKKVDQMHYTWSLQRPGCKVVICPGPTCSDF